MNPIKNNSYFLKVSLKVGLSIICYLAFTIYTVPAYTQVRAYVGEKMFTDKRAIVIGNTSLSVDVVDDAEERARGLSGRKELLPYTGMLFIFEEARTHGIWMKDMNFNIDVIWFNVYGEVVYFVEDLSPESYPTVLTPPLESLYILEVPSGFIKQNGIKVGDRIDFY